MPEQLWKCPANAVAQELLEEVLGIVVLVRLGNQQIAWSITSAPALTNTLQRNYSADAYSAMRANLGIDSHWIVLINPEVMFTLKDLYEAHIDLVELEIQPECVVMPV